MNTKLILSILIAYGGFAIAELLLILQGIATVVSGILLSFAFFKKRREKRRISGKPSGGFWNLSSYPCSPIPIPFYWYFKLFPLIQFQDWTPCYPPSFYSFPGLARFLVLSGILLSRTKVEKKFSLFLGKLFFFPWSGIEGLNVVVLLSFWTEVQALGQKPFNSVALLLTPISFPYFSPALEYILYPYVEKK